MPIEREDLNHFYILMGVSDALMNANMLHFYNRMMVLHVST